MKSGLLNLTAALGVLLLVGGCTGKDKEVDTEEADLEEPMKAREIIDTYTDTLRTSPDRARDSAAIVEGRDARQMNELKELDKY